MHGDVLYMLRLLPRTFDTFRRAAALGKGGWDR